MDQDLEVCLCKRPTFVQAVAVTSLGLCWKDSLLSPSQTLYGETGFKLNLGEAVSRVRASSSNRKKYF